MRYVESISQINKVYNSKGSKPVRVLCDDFEEYVCKYNVANGSMASKLFREYIGASFIKIWGLNVPDFTFVNIKNEHLTVSQHLQPSFFRTTCFGSKFSKNFKELDKFTSFIEPKQKKAFENKFDFLKVALFDLWISNEDRYYGNFNLLYDVEDSNRFVPIDHEMIFNTGSIDRGLELISREESLLDTPMTNNLFSKKELRKIDYLPKVQEEYYFCIRKCEEELNQILKEVPDDWLVNIEKEKNTLLQELFNKDWIDTVFAEFSLFIQSIK